MIVMSEEENERQYGLIDQRLSAHAILRDRCGFRALCLSITLLSISIALNAFVFAGDDILVAIFRIPAKVVKVFLGITSVAVLVLSIVGLLVNWLGEKLAHTDAVKRLSQLKAQFRRSHDDAAGATRSADEIERLTCEYNRVMPELPPIPERHFAKLKAAHAFKRMVSEEISAHPGVPALIVSIKLRCKTIRRFCTKGHSKNAGNMGSE